MTEAPPSDGLDPVELSGSASVSPTEENTDIEFQDTSTLEPTSVSGKINQPSAGKIGQTTEKFLTTSDSELSSNLLDDDEVKWKLFSFYSNLKKRRWFKTFRSPIEFCSTANFSRPESRKDISERIGLNSKYFFTNYVILCILLLSYSIISKPSLVLCIGIFMWMYMYATNHEEIRIWKIPIKGRVKFGILACLAIFVFVWLAGNTIVFTLSLCALVIAVHMCCHSSVNPEDVDDDFDPLDQLP